MMKQDSGHEPEATHYVLTFDELPAKGLEITVRAGTVRERLAFDRMRFADLGGDLEKVMEREEAILATFAGRLVSWNRTLDGRPVEPSLDALLDLEDPVVQQIVEGWISTITGTVGPGKSREPDPMASTPMTGIEDTPGL